MSDQSKKQIQKSQTNKSKSSNKKDQIPSLTKMKDYFETISKEDFKTQIDQLLKIEDLESLQLFLYYLMLFRELDNVRDCLNDEGVPIEFIEKLIVFILGYCSKYDYSAIPTIDIMLLFLSEDRLLELIQKSKFIRADKLLMFHILTRLDKNSLDAFFSDQNNLLDAVSSYYKLPEDVMTDVIARNRKFFDFIMMKLSSVEELSEEAKRFIKKFDKIISELKTMGHIIMKYHTEVDLTVEGKRPFNERDKNRISFLVNTIRSMPDWNKAVDYFTQGGVFVDEQERQIVYALVSDPILKSIFQTTGDYNSDDIEKEESDNDNEPQQEDNYFNQQIHDV